MKFLWPILLGIVFCVATPAAAATEIAAGEACKISTIGIFTCVWTDIDGLQTTATGTANVISTHNNLQGAISVSEVPLIGWIEVEIPYLASTWDYRYAERLSWFNYLHGRTTDQNARAIGTVSMSAEFTGNSCRNGADPCVSELALNSIYLGGFHKSDLDFNCCQQIGNGAMRLSMKWQFREDADLRFISASSGFGVPEPSNWAFLIAGFGLTGVSLRRRAYKLA